VEEKYKLSRMVVFPSLFLPRIMFTLFDGVIETNSNERMLDAEN
jgi:hypothetical protein